MNDHKQPEQIVSSSEEKDSQISSLQEKNLLLIAEIENQRKVNIKEIEQAVKYANRKILLKIIPLIENYKRALSIAKESRSKTAEGFVIGFEMILADFKESIKSEGVQEYSPQPYKEIWNSNFCEVVDEVENNEYENGTVIKVFQNGYFLHERLLSPAKVVISKVS